MPLIAALTGFCSLMYELALAQLLSSILGNTVFRYATTLAVYTLSLGLGSFFFKSSTEVREIKLFVRAEIFLAVLGIISPFVFVGIFSAGSWISNNEFHNWLILIVTHGLIAAIGFISGYELPILSSLADRKISEGSVASTKVLAFDYFGMFLASIAFPLMLFPTLGAFSTIWFTTALNLVAAFLTLPLLKVSLANRELLSFRIVATLAVIGAGNILLLTLANRFSSLLSLMYAKA